MAWLLSGHWPWFVVYNYLDKILPVVEDQDSEHEASKGVGGVRANRMRGLMRNACIGFAASVASDCTSNSVRVIKSVKQTSLSMISYRGAAKQVLEQDGIAGLLGRGLGVKLLSNGISAMLFTVVWKGLAGHQQERRKAKC